MRYCEPVRLSVTARIALLSIALALASNLVLVAAVWRQTRGDALDAVRRETTEQADALVAVWRTDGDRALVEAIDHATTPGDHSQVLAVLDAQGRIVAGGVPQPLGVPLKPTPFRIEPLGDSPTARDVAYLLHRVGDRWLLTGRGLDLLAAEQRALAKALGVAALLSLGFGVAAGLVLARFVGRRLDRIATVIDAAGEGDLSRRVGAETAGAGDAFDRLAGRLDAMLEKIERLMGELRVVTDSLAHDLRSPLARLRSRAEAAVLAEPLARDAALSGLIAETDLVMGMLTTAIEISRSEAVARDRLHPASPAALVEQIADLYAPVAEEEGAAFTLALDADPPAMPLHRELLSQAVANLLDNALKHAAGSALTLRLSAGADAVAIAVEDRGPGIAAADRELAVKRFGRLDAARSVPGAGLGMALVEAVARLHGGRLELADNAPGLVARIVLPLRV